MCKHTTSQDTRLYTPAMLAERWGVAAKQVREWASEGRLPHQRIGTHIYVPAQVVRRFEACEPDSTHGLMTAVVAD